MALTPVNTVQPPNFINLADNLDLDYTTKKGKGYAVFGEVMTEKKH